MRRLVAVFLFVLFLPLIAAAQGIITTVAGNGTAGSGGDGGPAVNANLNFPVTVALDPSGNLFITEDASSVIRKVDTSGLITTVPGLTSGADLAFDAYGNLFISGGSRVLRVTPGSDGVVDGSADEVITTVVGTGAPCLPTTDPCGDGGPATSATLFNPFGLAFDADGNLFISDISTFRVREVVPGSDGVINGGADETIITVAGNGQHCSLILAPCGVGGPATSAPLSTPTKIALDAYGNLYFGNAEEGSVLRVEPGSDGVLNGGADETITTVFTGFADNRSVAFDPSGNLYVANTFVMVIQKVEPGSDGIINGGGDETASVVAGVQGTIGFNGDNQPAVTAWLNRPQDLAFDTVGNMFIADRTNQRIRKVSCAHCPVANAGPDQTIILGESAQFNGSGSSDPDGPLASFVWDFGDSTSASGAIVGHVYTSAGTFTARLTVTDGDANAASDTAGVTVLSAAQAIQSVSALVQSFNLQMGISNSLDAKLENALEALDAAKAGKRSDASNKLMAFITSVNAQRGKQITDEQADALVALAMRILATL